MFQNARQKTAQSIIILEVDLRGSSQACSEIAESVTRLGRAYARRPCAPHFIFHHYFVSSLPLQLLTALIIMEVSFALTGKGYVLIAADMSAAHSIIKVKTDVDKIKELSPHLLMAFSGEPGEYLPIRTYMRAHAYLCAPR